MTRKLKKEIKPKPELIRVTVFVRPPVANWLRKEKFRSKRTYGGIVEDLVKTEARSRKNTR